METGFLSYLKQPHPAQILGIMRILGIGYSNNQNANGIIGKILHLFDLND
jgi:hypothetical protein